MHLSPTHRPQPYQDEAINTIYELFFCDNIELYKKQITTSGNYPWVVLFDSSPDVNSLHKIAFDDALESRVRMLAYDALRRNGHPIEEKELLGVIVEVGLEEGLDVLASYEDGTARYINYTGSLIVWDAKDQVSEEITAQLFRDSLNIVHRIGPWTEPRRAHPEKGIVRISFLVSDGLYFGEGPINGLFNDELAAPALASASALMQYLTTKVLENKI
jgi:hypothetical protein